MFRKTALALYYHASLPLRLRRNRALARVGRAPAIVLFYHRVADDGANDWTCSFATFVRQMDWLRRHFEMVDLEEVQSRVRSPRSEYPCASVTFDDGYAVNCDRALPFLVRSGIPCTYFVTSENVLEGAPFAHDVARGKPDRPNTPAELRSLADAGIEIGAHTRTHRDLGICRDAEVLRDETAGAKADLERALGRPVRYFAFPFGLRANLSRAAFAAAHRAGYAAVCSAYGGYNFPGDDPFHLQRVHGGNDLIRLKNWATLDPRKRRIARYDYGTQAATMETEGALA
jgi:peptidoglycan/xylan/chitin deacetylase (PgdA/CDA1 family)